MVGEIKNGIDQSLHPYIHFYGAINDEATLFKIYLEHDVLIMASSQEGFPISIMEAMAAGCIILSTPVGDIPYHVKQGVNGFLFSSIQDEKTIIKEAVDYIQQIQNDSALQFQMSKDNQEYAQKEFELSIFETRYKALLEPSN
jgi:glycosyltransferase involved in cell wall biosynthesis